eukprot:10432955-Alexandrium_andersonii.AAC.1
MEKRGGATLLATRAPRLLQVHLLTMSHEEGIGECPTRGDRKHVSARKAGAETLRTGLRLVDRDRVPPARQACSGGISARRGKPTVEPEGSPMPTQHVKGTVPLALVLGQK